MTDTVVHDLILERLKNLDVGNTDYVMEFMLKVFYKYPDLKKEFIDALKTHIKTFDSYNFKNSSPYKDFVLEVMEEHKPQLKKELSENIIKSTEDLKDKSLQIIAENIVSDLENTLEDEIKEIKNDVLNKMRDQFKDLL